ncbi:hypothetical protein GYB62_03025, partial [bacterium]|nr:hypothetical protein [bacterium]
MLNALWLFLFFTAFIAALYQSLILGQHAVFSDMVAALYEMSKLSLDISIGLIGLMALWLGFFRIAESAGVIQAIARGLSPLFYRLMPDIPRGDAAIGSVAMNLSANALGLDNAATPMGLKAMRDLQQHNRHANTASNAQILFLVLNTSSVTLIPITVFLYRAQLGAANPSDVFIPIVLA